MATILPVRHKQGEYAVALVVGSATRDELTAAGSDLAQTYGIPSSTGKVEDLQPNSRGDGDRLLIVTQSYGY